MRISTEYKNATIFDKSRPGTAAVIIPQSDVPVFPRPSDDLLRTSISLPEVSEGEVVRHFTELARRNFSIESGMYPLGSCTMKYNPRRNERALLLAGFSNLHPEQPTETLQGAFQMMWELQTYLTEITGMSGATLAPLAGAHGELTGVLIMRAFHKAHGEDTLRRKMLIPDSAHGTNPASAAMGGYEVEKVLSDKYGNTDIEDLRSKLNGPVAGVMITQPNTLGLFDTGILEIADLVHRNGALLYGDGANMNALLGKVKPGDLGFDLMHMNTHKTFGTPHGGGGPGAGPVVVKEGLLPFLPDPVVVERNGKFALERPEFSIGRMGAWYGNFAVLLRAYSYIRTLGEEGLRNVAENAVLNANYLKRLLSPYFDMPYGVVERVVMHEVVLSGARQKRMGITTEDMAKRLIDYGFHPPTIYFPQIVTEAMMIEPTETEPKDSIDEFAKAMISIAQEVQDNPNMVRTAPNSTPLGRLDGTRAARNPILRWKPKE